jgi:hypothetical protein
MKAILKRIWFIVFILIYTITVVLCAILYVPYWLLIGKEIYNSKYFLLIDNYLCRLNKKIIL